LKKNVSAEAASKTRILYGGSVTEKNAAELIMKKDVDGFLGQPVAKTDTCRDMKRWDA